MSAERFKPVGQESAFSQTLVQYYRARAKTGRPPYDPALLLKMLLAAYLYNLSERQVEEAANFNLLASGQVFPGMSRE